MYCSSIANTRITSVGAIHITKSKVPQIICRSNFNSLLAWVVASFVLKNP